MDISQFQTGAPGEIIPIPEGDHAFVPYQLPPKWDFPVRLWPLVAEAKMQVGILEGLGRNLPNPAILLRPLEDREAITSSRLEGTYASPRELLLFEMQPGDPQSEAEPANDWREVFNYRKALYLATQSELPLSLRLIKDLHAALLSGVRGRERSPGEFRRVQVAIGVTRRFVPPPAERLMECLDPLEKYFHVSRPEYDPMVECFLAHYQFEAIHPFTDGNGRVGRLLLALMLYRRCGLSKPWLHMSEYYEKRREEYVQRLFDVSARAAWGEWVEFCLQGVVVQARATIRRCEQLLEVQQRFMSRLADVGGSVRLIQIVERVFHAPFVRVADLARQLEVTYPTAKADVERLVQAGILQELDNATPKTYFAPEVYRIAYGELD